MDNYIKTIINGLKAWTTSGLTRLEASVSKLSGNLDALGSKIISLSSKVTKHTSQIAELQEYENKTYGIATVAQTTANEAKSAAFTAQTTANNAQTTANNARTTANNAQTTADNAQTTADDAKKNAIVKWETGMLGCIYDAGKNGTVLIPPTFTADAPVAGSSIIYLLVASFKGTGTRLTGITGISINAMYANFEESVTIDQFDLLEVTMTAGASSWQAKKTGINLGANALVTALSEVYEE